MIGADGERESGKSMLVARLGDDNDNDDNNDDDDNTIKIYTLIYFF